MILHSQRVLILKKTPEILFPLFHGWTTPKRADNFANHGNPFFFNEHELLLSTYARVLELLIFDCDLKILSVHVKIMIEMIFAGHKKFAIGCV